MIALVIDFEYPPPWGDGSQDRVLIALEGESACEVHERIIELMRCNDVFCVVDADRRTWLFERETIKQVAAIAVAHQSDSLDTHQ